MDTMLDTLREKSTPEHIAKRTEGPKSNTTRAARAAQGCTDNGVRVDAGTLLERRSGEERRYRNN